MVEHVNPTNPSDESKKSEAAQAASKKDKGPPPQYGKMTGKPMTFLGMHFTGPEAEKLWDSIMQQINSQIQKEQKRALEALRKLRKSSTGEGNG